MRPPRAPAQCSDPPQQPRTDRAPCWPGAARGGPLGNWDIFLNVINVEARTGCTLAHLLKTLYGWEEKDGFDSEHSNVRFAFKFCVIRPLWWLGLLWEDRESLNLWEDGTYYKTPLWQAALKLDTDGQAALRLV